MHLGNLSSRYIYKDDWFLFDMDLTTYINKRVQIILVNGFTYIGLVINADDNSLVLIDKNNSNVSLSEKIIATIIELGDNKKWAFG